MDGVNLEKIHLLISHKRFENAVSQLREALAAEPESGRLHGLLAFCLGELKRLDEAIEAAGRAIACDPSDAYPHYVMSRLFLEVDETVRAQDAIQEALRLDPEDADYHGLHGAILLERRHWQEALAAARRGLALEADNAFCFNIQSMALRQLNRGDEAGRTLKDALSVEPDNPTTLANLGWQHLDQRQYEQAKAMFLEALRIDPQLAWARQGLAEILKAKNPLYRFLLRYFIWISKMEDKKVWVVLIGGYVLVRGLSRIADSNPDLEPFLTPVIILYVVFAIFTWIGTPVFNLVLWLHPLGRHLLDVRDKLAARWVGACLGLALIGGGLWVASDQTLWVVVMGLSVGMAIVLAGALGCEEERPRRFLVVYAWVMGVLAVLSLLLWPMKGIGTQISLALFGVGFAAYAWVANFLFLKR